MEPPALSSRKASRALRREQLIEATIATIARKGLSQMTLTDVALAAGVSHGLVNFHFQSKERLLAETLRFMSEEHRRIWSAALADAGPDPARQLNALILCEFESGGQTAERLTAWCAFWGEAQNRPLYLEQCGENDRAHIDAFETACRKLVTEASYAVDAARAARILRLAIEGMWLELMFSARPYDRPEALATAFVCAAALFPRHFSEDGLIRA
ncbi:MAG: TetR family transcriptional regulator C-terminal domain-containing protein [Aestuariivirga sp.]|uniref:TetR family transcriptional regulator C-terminal domain-containing protein n=1 Tax=Aestuariivirga sp. TaxID=2650926 RepID=UPI0038CFC207